MKTTRVRLVRDDAECWGLVEREEGKGMPNIIRHEGRLYTWWPARTEDGFTQYAESDVYEGFRPESAQPEGDGK